MPKSNLSFTGLMKICTKEEKAHTQKVLRYLRDAINAQGGKITFAQFMQIALYEPKLGYYAQGKPLFGPQGDFVTAPEISPLFGKCVAKQCSQVLAVLPQASILEFGAGSGKMAADILLALEEHAWLPDYYYIFEISATLRERQQQTFKQHCPHLRDKIQWLEKLPQQDFRGIILANEVLDAIPVHKFNISDTRVQEYYVIWEQDRLAWQLGEPSSQRLLDSVLQLKANYFPANQTYTSEVNLGVEDWLQQVNALLAQGLILLIDYGFPGHEFYHPQRDSGTLMCHLHHLTHSDPLILPGVQDISAHVDFTAIAESAINKGLDVVGFTHQAAFLMNSGLTSFIDPHASMTTHSAIKLLTLPTEMGELVKVMALTRKLEPELIGQELMGFAAFDRRHYLGTV